MTPGSGMNPYPPREAGTAPPAKQGLFRQAQPAVSMSPGARLFADRIDAGKQKLGS